MELLPLVALFTRKQHMSKSPFSLQRTARPKKRNLYVQNTLSVCLVVFSRLHLKSHFRPESEFEQLFLQLHSYLQAKVLPDSEGEGNHK